MSSRQTEPFTAERACREIAIVIEPESPIREGSDEMARPSHMQNYESFFIVMTNK
jgi:hypothetical protein